MNIVPLSHRPPTIGTESPQTCSIPANDPLFKRYHDEEWGVPVVSDQKIFEKLCLEGFQAGLSWRIILHRRESFRQAFDQFDPDMLKSYTESDINRLLNDKRIIRNRRKILSVINNANRLAELQNDAGSLAAYLWSFEPSDDNRPERVSRQWLEENPFTTESHALSADLKRRGWSYVGPTNMHALMQSSGVVNDHVQDCPRRDGIEQLRKARQGKARQGKARQCDLM